MKRRLSLALLLIFFAVPASAGFFDLFDQPAPILNQAKNNVTLVYDTQTGEPRMIVIDAQDLSDPAWNPPGTAQLPIAPQTYNSLTAPGDLDNYLLQLKAIQ